MSNPIVTGCYYIRNVMYPNRYICMSGNQHFVGHDVPHKIYVEVLDVVSRIVTLKDISPEANVYLTLDPEIHRVVGKQESEVVQLTSDNNFQFRIQRPNENQVAYLTDDGNWSWIYVGPAPESGSAQFWKFEMVDCD